MSYETDKLSREVDNLKWQKAENYKLEELNNKVRHLQEQLTQVINKLSYLEERILKLEQGDN